MLSNKDFLKAIFDSFKEFLSTGTSRSTNCQTILTTSPMLSNEAFLRAIFDSFKAFLSSGGKSCSTQKLKPLHGTIAKGIADRLGKQYEIISQG